MNTIHLTPAQRRWQRFKANRQGYYSLWLFSGLFILSLFAEVLSNDKPLLIYYNNQYYFPLVKTYSETTFGGDFDTEADYKDSHVQELLSQSGNWLIFPLNPYSYNTINRNSEYPNPAAPSAENVLGTDDQGRDVLARLIYGFRLSVVFAFILTIIGVVTGILVGAIQGYLGGRVDLLTQRFIEIWGSMPALYLLIIFTAILKPSVALLIILLSLFDWMGLADYVRAEFLRGRTMDYVRSAQALGVPDHIIVWRHLLPNAMTPVITFLPFRISGAILALTSLDFLGLGLPYSEPSLGELLKQSQTSLSAWWLSLPTFTVLVGMLTLLVFIGDALREALDTRRG